MDHTMIPLLDREHDDDLEAHGREVPPTAMEIPSPPMIRGRDRFAPRTPPPSPETAFNTPIRAHTPSSRTPSLLHRRLSVESNATVPSMTLDASTDDVSASWDAETSSIRDVGLGIGDDEVEIEVHYIDYEDDVGFQHVEFIKDPPPTPEGYHDASMTRHRPWSPRQSSRPSHQFYGLSSVSISQPMHVMRPIASLQDRSQPLDLTAISNLPLPSRSAPEPPLPERRLSRRPPRTNNVVLDSFLDITSDSEDTIFARSAAFTSRLAKRISDDHRGRRLKRTAHKLLHGLMGCSRVHKSRKSSQPQSA